MKEPRFRPGLFVHCIHYSEWSITDTPLESAGLARVLIIPGLDKILAAFAGFELVVRIS
jgi:hypothetical protein